MLLYGHLDKQPEMTGWRDGLGPWKPVIEGDRLYGRGGADDGYAAFASLLAIEAAQASGLATRRCVVLIEASEESGSPDLPAYLEALADRIGTPSLVLCLDSGCLDYERLWVTTSLRGLAGGTLRVDILTEGVHSGEASGVVPSTFRICRELLDRIEDSFDGRILLPELHVEIPDDRREQAAATAAEFPIGEHFPFVDGARADGRRPHRAAAGPHVAPDAERHRRRRHPARRVRRQRAAAAHRAAAQRPPAADVRPRRPRAMRCAPRSTDDPPYGAHVTLRRRPRRSRLERADVRDRGCRPRSTRPRSATSATSRGRSAKAARSRSWACSARCSPTPSSSITGVLGPGANAHGPNEFLHLPTARRITQLPGDRARRPRHSLTGQRHRIS